MQRIRSTAQLCASLEARFTADKFPLYINGIADGAIDNQRFCTQGAVL
jgi:hypothetical protein